MARRVPGTTAGSEHPVPLRHHPAQGDRSVSPRSRTIPPQACRTVSTGNFITPSPSQTKRNSLAMLLPLSIPAPNRPPHRAAPPPDGRKNRVMARDLTFRTLDTETLLVLYRDVVLGKDYTTAFRGDLNDDDI